MKKFSESCSDEMLQTLLHENEDSSDFHIAAEHVEECPACQTRLTNLAAGDDEWKVAEQSLVANDFNTTIERECAERSWSDLDPSRPPASWNDAMSKQLLSPPSHPEMLGRLGRYEIERLIGAGGMGVVFKGFDSELNRPAAVKVLAPHLAGSGAARKRFAREARAAAAVVHEHVVAIHNVESDAEPPFLVMQFVAGESLQQRLDRQGPLSVPEILRIASQTAAGLAAAHKQGLVHRDVKPSNIMLESGVDRALLTDFGLARASDDASLTHSGYVPGTPHYMSPEQARGDNTDQHSDLFSLGSVMYAMCTGRLPFRAETSYGVLRRITDDEPTAVSDVNSGIPKWLSVVVQRLMKKRTEDRFASAEQTASLLEDCLAHVQQPNTVPLPKEVAPESHVARAARLIKRKKKTCVSISACLLGLMFWQSTMAPDVSGEWHDDEWGQVVLTEVEPQKYSGTYTDPFGGDLGTIDVAWSRIERRYNGKWKEGDRRFGDISLRLVDGKVQGAFQTSKSSMVNPGTPALAEFVWQRGKFTPDIPIAVKIPALGHEPLAFDFAFPYRADDRTFSFYVGTESTASDPTERWDAAQQTIRTIESESKDVLKRINQPWGETTHDD